MRSLWKGFVTFGLVTIPVRLYTAVDSSDDVKFHLLHRKDGGRIRNRRTCEKCDKEVEWEDIARGYEYAEDQYVELTEEELEAADPEASSSIEILDFCDASEIDLKLFDHPYWLEPQKGGEKPYALLREALRTSGRVGIAKVVMKSRESLVCVRPDGDAIQVEVLRWADEVRDAGSLTIPRDLAIQSRELVLAGTLIDQMTAPFDATKYHDEYREKVRSIIDEKVKGAEPAARGEAPAPTKVIDLMKVLKESLVLRGGAKPATKAPARSNGLRLAGTRRKAG